MFHLYTYRLRVVWPWYSSFFFTQLQLFHIMPVSNRNRHYTFHTQSFSHQIKKMMLLVADGTLRVKGWSDVRTFATRDDRYSAQFEHTLLVIGNGCEILTKRQTNDGNPWFMDSL